MNKPRLLIVDDERDICELIVDVAELRGFETQCVVTPDGVEAALLAFKPDAIMLDLMMPGTDGVELLRQLDESIRTCAIVLMSGHDQRVLSSAKRLGIAHGLNIISTQEKPIDIAVLRGTLDALFTLQDKREITLSLIENAAVQKEEIALFYQPIVEMATGKVRGLEALVRWYHPQHGLLTPDRFLSNLDEKNFSALAHHIMQVAVADAARFHALGFGLAISINMTASNLIDLAVPDRLDALCQQHKLKNDRINIEVTEGEAMRDVRRTMEVLTRLRLRGFGVAIDDFGIGYSSLRELQRLPFSVMKMDKSFITDMVENRDSRMITQTVIDLGHNLNLKVVAEGVETLEVYRLLQEKNCDLAQGYLMSRPQPFDKLAVWLQGNQGVYVAGDR